MDTVPDGLLWHTPTNEMDTSVGLALRWELVAAASPLQRVLDGNLIYCNRVSA